jgi:hypothetical protein
LYSSQKSGYSGLSGLNFAFGEWPQLLEISATGCFHLTGSWQPSNSPPIKIDQSIILVATITSTAMSHRMVNGIAGTQTIAMVGKRHKAARLN